MLAQLPRKQAIILMLAIVIGWIIGERFASPTDGAPWIDGEIGVLVALVAAVGLLFAIEYLVAWLVRRSQS